MNRFEYKVIPAPLRGQKGKGVKGADGKFAHALEQTMNQMGAQGWDYLRAEVLPSEERAGLTSKTTVFRNVLVFRKTVEPGSDTPDPKLLEAPNAKPDIAASPEDINQDPVEPDLPAPIELDDMPNQTT